MTTSLEIVVEFDSRWRIGTGTSRSGAVDDETWAAASDRHLVVPASHLKRRLRERAEVMAPLVGMDVCPGRLAAQQRASVAGVCDPDDPNGAAGPGAEPCVGCRLFGSPRCEPRWQFTSGVIDLHGADRTDPIVVDAEREQRVHNRIDPWARRTAEDLLFVHEVGRAGLRFRASATTCLPTPPPDDEVALLVAAVGSLETLGARGRRGFGACRAWVAGSRGGRDHDAWVDRFVDAPW